jgi:hypothetical protein
MAVTKDGVFLIHHGGHGEHGVFCLSRRYEGTLRGKAEWYDKKEEGCFPFLCAFVRDLFFSFITL